MPEPEHLDELDFHRLLLGELDRWEQVRSDVHLLDCKHCSDAFFAYDEEGALAYLVRRDGLEGGQHWRKVMKQRKALPGPAVPVDMIAAVAAVEELERHEPRRWQFIAANRRSLQTPDSIMYLLEASRDQWQDEPELAEYLIHATLSALRRAELEPGLRAALLARAHAYAGNVHRIFGRHRKAWEAFEVSRHWIEQGDLGVGVEAELAWFEGGLLRDGRRLEEAVERLEFAVACPDLTGGEEGRQEATVTLGITYGEAGRFDEAIETLESVLAGHSKSDFPPRLYLNAVQSLAVRYVHVGRLEEARAMLHDIRDVAQQLGQRMILLRVTWFEAELCHAEGNRVGAATRYREVQEAFMEKGIPYDAALASLSLAELHLEHDDTAAAAELAEELIPIFESKGIHRESLAAGRILIEALRKEEATVEDVRRVAETMRAVRA